MLRCDFGAIRPRIASARCLVAVLGGILIGGARAGGQTTSFWLNPVSGNWTDPTKWSTDPVFPNNDGSVTFNAVIDATGAPYTVTSNSNIFVESFVLDSPDATLVVPAGSLGVDVPVSADIRRGSVHVNGGALDLGWGTFAGGGQILLSSGTLSSDQLRVRDNSQIIQNGGLHTLGIAFFESASYTMSGGSLSLGGQVEIGRGGTATFMQTGGTVSQTGLYFITGGQNRGAGTTIIDGSSALYVVPPGFSDRFAIFGLGTASRGTGIIRNGASVTFGNTQVGVALGAGTLIIESGANVTMRDLDVGIGSFSIGGGPLSGNGTLLLRGTQTQLNITDVSTTVGGVAADGSTGYIRVEDGAFNGIIVAITRNTGSFEILGGNVQSGFVVRGLLTKSGGNLNGPVLVSDGQFIHSGGTGSLSSATINNATSGTFLLSGGSLNVSNLVHTAGASALTGGNLASGTATLSGGSMTIAGANLAGSGTWAINSGAQVNFDSGSFSVGPLSIDSGQMILSSGGDKVVRATNLSITGAGGQLDLSDNAMVIDYTGASVLPLVQPLFASGYANGAWTGDGVNSSAAAANPGYALGYAEASALTSIPAIFGTVDSTAILIRYTRYGDADIDGVVGLKDFNRLASNFGSGQFWFEGDFNFDGLVDIADFNLLAGNFGLSASPAGPTAADWAALASVVPEPGFLPLVGGLALVGLLRRMRQRNL